jgi:hypothetical protein
MLTGEDYLVGLVEIGLDYTLPGERLTAVLSLDREDVEAGWSRLGQWNVGAGILLALLGTILLAWTLRSIRRPYEEIDAAVHGIILGDVHARIPFEFSEPQARSLGQSLSLMQSVLLGEPLPEEQEASSAWGRDLVIAAEEGSGGAASGHETVREEDMTESRDAYFQRLFGEFVAARRALGENPSTVSMGTFVERVVRTEMGLRKRLHCKAVRFRVEVKNGQVALVPIRVE